MVPHSNSCATTHSTRATASTSARRPGASPARLCPTVHCHSARISSAVVSGPIIKNRTFFSASYDGYRYSQPTLALSYAPTAAELAGDFSRTPFGRDIYNPYSTRQVGAAFVRDRFRCDDAARLYR